MNIILIYFAIKYEGNWDKIFEALEKKEKVSIEDIKNTEKFIEDDKWKVITIIDIDYPQKLKEAYKPPFVIWLKGNIKLLDQTILTLTGDHTSDLSNKRVEEQLSHYEDKYSLLLLDFKGLNDHIKKTATKPYIEVIAKGIDYSDQSKNLQMTEYPPETQYKKEHFKNRNRIIAALSKSLILFNSKKDGKINNLVSNFLNLGKEIYCYPGDGSENDGNSELVKQGALLITNIDDIE